MRFIFSVLGWAVIIVLLAIAFMATPLIFVVEVLCECGRWITIRGAVGTTKICWTCSRVVWFGITGTTKAVRRSISGKNANEKPSEGVAHIIWRGK